MSFANARFTVDAAGKKTGVLLNLQECEKARNELEELEALRLKGRVLVPSNDGTAALKAASEPNPGRRIIADVLEGRARRYLTDENATRLGVIMSQRDYKIVCRALEDLEDIKVLQERDAARARGDPDEQPIPIEQVFPDLARKRG